MRKIAIAIAAALFSTGALAFGGFNPYGSIGGVGVSDGASANVGFGGGASISSKSSSSAYGNASSTNQGYAESYQYGAGSASTYDNRSRDGQGFASYEAEMVLINEVYTGSKSQNYGYGADGYSDNRANAGSGGRLGGSADSTTFSWEVDTFFGFPLPWTYDSETLSNASSDASIGAGGGVSSHSRTGGGHWLFDSGEVVNSARTVIEADLYGHAGTTPTATSALAGGSIYTFTDAQSDILWGNAHGHADAGAGGRGNTSFNGNVGTIND